MASITMPPSTPATATAAADTKYTANAATTVIAIIAPIAPPAEPASSRAPVFARESTGPCCPPTTSAAVRATYAAAASPRSTEPGRSSSTRPAAPAPASRSSAAPAASEARKRWSSPGIASSAIPARSTAVRTVRSAHRLTCGDQLCGRPRMVADTPSTRLSNCTGGRASVIGRSNSTSPSCSSSDSGVASWSSGEPPSRCSAQPPCSRPASWSPAPAWPTMAGSRSATGMSAGTARSRVFSGARTVRRHNPAGELSLIRMSTLSKWGGAARRPGRIGTRPAAIDIPGAPYSQAATWVESTGVRSRCADSSERSIPSRRSSMKSSSCGRVVTPGPFAPSRSMTPGPRSRSNRPIP